MRMKERMDQIDKEVKELDETAQKRVRNLEFAADRYLWFPDPDSTEKVRVGRMMMNERVVSLLSEEAVPEHAECHRASEDAVP